MYTVTIYTLTRHQLTAVNGVGAILYTFSRRNLAINKCYNYELNTIHVCMLISTKFVSFLIVSYEQITTSHCARYIGCL